MELIYLIVALALLGGWVLWNRMHNLELDNRRLRAAVAQHEASDRARIERERQKELAAELAYLKVNLGLEGGEPLDEDAYHLLWETIEFSPDILDDDRAGLLALLEEEEISN